MSLSLSLGHMSCLVSHQIPVVNVFCSLTSSLQNVPVIVRYVWTTRHVSSAEIILCGTRKTTFVLVGSTSLHLKTTFVTDTKVYSSYIN